MAMINCPGCGEENPAKFRLCGYCGVALAAAAPAALPVHEVRKTVTLVFSDLKGSTALGERLDPEAVREVMDRYFKAMAAEITRHGGKIEKYIGDAIMAVFGLPRAHEDDALRAVRAAAGMRAALRQVNEDLMQRYGVALANRTGVNTGEVVANDDPNASQKLATGDAVNVAARLEQAAPENEIYLGETTYRLVRDAVTVETVEPLELKGKAERVAAFRLVSAHGLDGSTRRQDTPVVGRDAELAVLDAAYHEACRTGAFRLVTVIGDAGVGKSRLVHEVVVRIAAGARVLRGRCLPYGDGITFWPLREMVGGAANILADDAPAEARAKLLALVGDADVVDRLAAATGLSDTPFPLHELYWAARKLLEVLAASGAVVAIIDDIHWAETAFLDLLDHLLDSDTSASVLLLATARHDLLEERPQWGERAGASRLVLKPLTDAASAQVVANLLGNAGLPDDIVRRIVGAAEGNPLFVEQMLSMLIDNRALRQEGDRWVRGERYAEIAVPPTIQALLEARLDRLGREERMTVEPAAVIGMQFALPAVTALAPEATRAHVGERLATLARKQFIQPASSAEGDMLYRFHHHLVRETVYGGLLKRSRATLHIDFVRWADRVNAERGRALEFEEILGYHLEQAHRYLGELGPLDAQGLAVGADAARRLAGAARRAFARGDMHAAANLYRRATALLPAADANRLALLPELGETLMELGDFDDARAVLDEAAAAAEQAGNQRIRASARIVRMLVRLYSAEPGDWSAEALQVVEESIPLLEQAGAHDELANAWRLSGQVHGIAARYLQIVTAIEKSIAHARLAGDARMVARAGLALSTTALYGPTPVPQAIEQCERIIADDLTNRQVEAIVMCTLAHLRAMNAEFDKARDLYRRGRALLRDLGWGVNAASTGVDVGRVEWLAGDLVAAERELRGDLDFLAKCGETFFLSTMAAQLSCIARELGDAAEAQTLSETAQAAAAEDDTVSQILWRLARTALLARAGELAEAEALARGAVELSRSTETPIFQADALVELASVLSLGGRIDEARTTLAAALAIYTDKGDLVSAARTSARADALSSSTPA
ncbi:MAG: adenylate/guanylate cyclase domain-containing protein [Pseudomonadota bacterium]